MTIRLYKDGTEITSLANQITWSGDAKQVSRKLDVTIAHNPGDIRMPAIQINDGDILQMYDGDRPLFGGPVMSISRPATGGMITYSAYDLLWYVNQSDISRVFDATPESVTRQICDELGIPLGYAAVTGIRVYMPCLGKSAYEAIMAAYTEAARQTGKAYIPLMQQIDKLCVMIKGTDCGVILQGDYNLTQASYTANLDNMVNRVRITDDTGAVVNTVADAASIGRYGVVQKVYQIEDGKDPVTAARSLLHGLDRSGSVTALSDVRAVSGYSLLVREPVTGLYGRFYIESDTHTFAAGRAEMQLTLAYDLMMDEREIDKGDAKKDDDTEDYDE